MGVSPRSGTDTRSSPPRPPPPPAAALVTLAGGRGGDGAAHLSALPFPVVPPASPGFRHRYLLYYALVVVQHLPRLAAEVRDPQIRRLGLVPEEPAFFPAAEFFRGVFALALGVLFDFFRSVFWAIFLR